MIKKMMILGAFLTASFAFTTHNALSSSAPTVELPKLAKIETPVLTAEEEVEKLYNLFSTNNTSVPALNVFEKAVKGYEKLETENKLKKNLLTVVDFSLPSTEKRMWILDMDTQEVLFHTYVSHGKNTGGNMATNFSNTPNSLQSSLGFYVTAETYYGKNGLSLFIDGMEEGFNSNARERYVVIHGADYAKEESIERLGRLGRSYGCPAVPSEVSKEIINKIKGGSALFIYHTSEDYIANSTYINSQAV